MLSRPATTSDISNTITKARVITKPGCKSKCGNLTAVPYPFGIGVGSGCSLDSSTWFNVNCNTFFNPPKAFIVGENTQIHDVSNSQISLILLSVSQTRNTFTVIGCDDLALITGSIKGISVAFAFSICSKAEVVLDYGCSVICCQIVIQKV
ncbi:hypothetical protein POM88_036456 [Heracleum sosnowskyi]|uniref:Wall-associated receptor kinase galacturonan-binding domain-containing protein n=1 Tax=Heracleum sosnowskyi TaxID=360622 RepID=A0AAD8HPT9_9APIA|nr:hypothetical protein POM88_036456 [Heracleum sosnowskyi]